MSELKEVPESTMFEFMEHLTDLANIFLDDKMREFHDKQQKIGFKFDGNMQINVIANVLGHLVANSAHIIGCHHDGSIKEKIELRDKFLKHVTQIFLNAVNENESLLMKGKH